MLAINAFGIVYESEGNDSIGTADDLGVAENDYGTVIVKGQVAEGDSDHYSFTVGTADFVTVDLDAGQLDGRLDAELSIINAETGVVVATERDFNGDDPYVHALSLLPGTYTIRVRAEASLLQIDPLGVTSGETGGIGNYTLYVNTHAETPLIAPTFLADMLIGTDGADVMNGAAGDDTILAGAGDDVVTGGAGDDSLSGGDGNDLFLWTSGDGSDTIDAGTGTDILEVNGKRFEDSLLVASAAEGALHVEVDGLRVVTASQVERLQFNGHQQQIRVDLTGDLTAAGLTGESVLVLGGQERDKVYAGGHAVRFEGGGGLDQVDYMAAAEGVVVDLNAQQRNAGAAADDTYHSVEAVKGTESADALYGSADDNVLRGMGGDDTLYGRYGDDELQGAAGDDVLAGNAGADTLDGGAGVDIAFYGMEKWRVKVDLFDAGRNALAAEGDVLESIENLSGTAFDDDLSGDSLANAFWGEAGDDILRGRNGDDTLFGGEGDDVLNGGSGADLFDGGRGVDRVLYTNSTKGLRVDLKLNATNTGEAAGDRFVSIEEVYGSRGQDVLAGDDGDNRIWGQVGRDDLYGRDGADVLLGGADEDRLVGGRGDDTLFGGEAKDSFVFKMFHGTDVVADFERGADKLLLDRGLLGAGVETRQDVIDAHASLHGLDVMFDFGGGDRVILFNVGTLDMEGDLVLI